MALQQINWTQIDTQNIPSGAIITLASALNPLEAVYTKNFGISGSVIVTGSIETSEDVTIGGNLTVKGTTTSIQSNVVTLGDNILELNGTSAAFGGLSIKDPTSPNTISGSLLWDTLNDRWIGGPLGSEQRIILQSDLDASSIWQETGSFYATTHDLQVTGSMRIKGDLIVEGQTMLVQTMNPNMESLIVSGAMRIVKNEISGQIISASLSIQNLGTLADINSFAILDCGDGFF